MTKIQQVNNDVIKGKISTICWDCATTFSMKPPYDGTYTAYVGKCDICHETKTVASARKLLGHHKFL